MIKEKFISSTTGKIFLKINMPVKKSKTKAVRDLRVTKECDTCGNSYHPRNNGYQATSRFCSTKCARTGRKNVE